MCAASEKVRLIASDVENLRLHYAYTLRHWLDRATAARAEDRQDVRRALLPHVGILSGRRDRHLRERRGLQLPGTISPRSPRASDHPRLHGRSGGALPQDRGRNRAREARARAPVHGQARRGKSQERDYGYNVSTFAPSRSGLGSDRLVRVDRLAKAVPGLACAGKRPVGNGDGVGQALRQRRAADRPACAEIRNDRHGALRRRRGPCWCCARLRSGNKRRPGATAPGLDVIGESALARLTLSLELLARLLALFRRELAVMIEVVAVEMLERERLFLGEGHAAVLVGVGCGEACSGRRRGAFRPSPCDS